MEAVAQQEPAVPASKAELRGVLEDLRRFRTLDTARSWIEASVSVALYVALWIATFKLIPVSIPAAAATGLACGLIMSRIFVLFHDTVHHALFRTPRANRWWGIVFGLILFTPYDRWRKSHIAHHTAVGDIERSDEGYLKLHTVKEFESWSRPKRIAYRIFRSPPVMVGLLPFVHFSIGHRLPAAWRKVPSESTLDVHLTTVVIVLMHVAAGFAVGGIGPLAQVQLPICIFAASIAGWLFFVQHHFEDAVWKTSRDEGWSYFEGAVHGSSYLRLSRPLGEWLWLGIGYHHVHHLDAKIPCYRLGDANRKVNDRLGVRGYTLWETIPFARLALWDEEQERMVPLPRLRQSDRAAATKPA